MTNGGNEKKQAKQQGPNPGRAGAQSGAAGAATTLAQTIEFGVQATGLLTGTRRVALQRSEMVETADQALWTAIRNRTLGIGFQAYREFIDRVLCLNTTGSNEKEICGADPLSAKEKLESRWRAEMPKQFHGVDAYNLLKVATETFLILECGVAIKPPKDPATGATGADTEKVPGEETRIGEDWTYQEAQGKLNEYLRTTLTDYFGAGKLPYLNRIVEAIFTGGDDPSISRPFCSGILEHRWSCPCLLELIWSFWHEEGMLVQTLNAISLRFQNRRGPLDHDPLARLKLDPLRPLSNIFWGYIQDEVNRLSLPRRVYEYDNHYGLTLVGKAVPKIRSADSRSKFIEAFHDLLYKTSIFFKEDDDTTVIADAFFLLNALKEVHLLLAQGAHNQFGDLPWTARVEMLVQQWLLARPETREYLGGPPMVPYQEAWMGAVDTMKSLQGWSDVAVSHFRDLGIYGEQILLSIRYGDWIAVNDPQQARNWARYWRPEIQAYIHSYRAVTGVDLSADLVENREARYGQPSVHHFRRFEQQRIQRSESTSLSGGRRNGGNAGSRERTLV